jgi:hypothetical protein
MGNTLKDAIVSMMLLDEKRGVKEQEVATSRYGWGRTEAEKQERLWLKELHQLLKIEKMQTSQQEGQFDEEESKGNKLKDGFEKHRLKISSKC